MVTRGSKIIAMGHYQPARVLTNDEIAQMVDTNDEWIRDRVGIVTRRIADTESVADMAAAAAGKALANSGLSAAEIDLVTVATCSSVDRCPNVATRVAAKLGIASPAAYDLNTACSGYEYAGAAVVTGVADDEEPGIGPVMWGSAPDKSDVITIEGWRPYIQQSGQTVFRWATFALPALAERACAAAGITPRDLAAFVPHQANLRIIEPLARKLGVVDAVVAKDIVESGNTSAASVPLALSKLVERREIPSGAPVLLFGFGGGLTYAGQVVRCP
ncbi:MAG: 3-oxoacyl-ACP synthase [Actinobacteria bacterium]|nr:MAG: 3-oxoacyl-ACP synthase [Actinomycetota bacterium]